MLLKKLVSYLIPIRVHTQSSKRSNSLEVTLVNGKLVLDSKHTNYSYGSLQKVLRKGLLHIGKQHIQQCNAVLILGVAGGSVIETLKKEFKSEAIIDAVEIDPDVLELAKTYFNLDQFSNTNLILDDAFQYIKTTTKQYDLIVVDLFNDNNMPEGLFLKSFWNNIHKSLYNNGLCMFNSMITLNDVEAKNETLKPVLIDLFKHVSSIKPQQHNELFILKK